jgi:hypothetical protein
MVRDDEDELKLAPEAERDRSDQEKKRYNVVPSDSFIEIEPREHDKHAESNHFLDDLQLKCSELAVADAIRWHLKAILEEGNQPAHDDRGYQRSLTVLQVSIPREGHENV